MENELINIKCENETIIMPKILTADNSIVLESMDNSEYEAILKYSATLQKQNEKIEQYHNELSQKANISAVPINISQLANDSHYVSDVSHLQSVNLKGQANGYAPLDSNGVVPKINLPEIATRNIGEVVTSTIPLNDAGLHLFDGALIQATGVYSEFVTYIAALVTTNPTLFATEQAWQDAVTKYGTCGKYVYDGVAKTVRLPKITGFIEGTTDVNALGDLVEAGLPNITGSFDGKNDTPTGCVSSVRLEAGQRFWADVDNNPWVRMSIDASRSSVVYGKSTKVQPQSIKILYYIVLATCTKTNVQVNIDNVITDLNGKSDVDFNNINNAGKSLMSSIGMPSGRYIDLTLKASGEPYIAPANGYYFLIYRSNGTYANLYNISKFGIGMYNMYTTVDIGGARVWTMCTKGDVIKLDYTNILEPVFRFIYAEGAKND